MQLRSFPTTYFLSRLADIEPLTERKERQFLRSDLAALVFEIAAEISGLVDVADIERRLTAEAALDVDALATAASLIAKWKMKPVQVGERTLEPSQLLQELRDWIGQLTERGHQLLDVEILSTVEMVLNPRFDELGVCATRVNYGPLIELAEVKLRAVPDAEVVTVWSRVQREFSDVRRSPMRLYDDILPKEFLSLGSADELRAKLARYVAELKPKLLRRMFEEGIDSYPLSPFGLARLLITRQPSALAEIRDIERTLARAFSTLGVLWVERLDRDLPQLARKLGLDPDGRVLAGPDRRAAAERLTAIPGEQAYPLLVYELKKVVRAVSTLVTYESPIEAALRYYKLGLEVMLPMSRAELKRLTRFDELALQKHASRFLIERGIHSAGRVFGRSQIDLVAETPADSLLIEAKVCKKVPSERRIRANLSQLAQYMDQSPVRRRGVLLYYNFSPTVMIGPRIWINGRYWILAVNMPKQAPSKNKTSLEIDEALPPELISVRRNNLDDSPSTAPKRKRRKARAPKKKAATGSSGAKPGSKVQRLRIEMLGDAKQGLSIEEIAKLTGLTVGTVRGYLYIPEQKRSLLEKIRAKNREAGLKIISKKRS